MLPPTGSAARPLLTPGEQWVYDHPGLVIAIRRVFHGQADAFERWLVYCWLERAVEGWERGEGHRLHQEQAD